jgi:hypothetical protein
MASKQETISIVECTRQEILFAVKERVGELTRGSGAPVQLEKAVIGGRKAASGEYLRYFEVKNIYIDDSNHLCGDLAGKDDRRSDGILFGKEIEDLPIDDLKILLDTLYTDRWSVDLADDEMITTERCDGVFGFLVGKKATISRLLRGGI